MRKTTYKKRPRKGRFWFKAATEGSHARVPL